MQCSSLFSHVFWITTAALIMGLELERALQLQDEIIEAQSGWKCQQFPATRSSGLP